MCLSLSFSPFLAQNLNFSYSYYGFWGIFAPIYSLTKIISGIKTIIENFDVRLHVMSLIIPIFVGGGEEAWGTEKERSLHVVSSHL